MLLSAALIVKNEEKLLEQCLSSLQGLVDEIIVVDTGSTDRTTAIASQYGAKLFNFKWRNDFAAARNFALDQVRCQWVLYVDADEQVRSKSVASLRKKLEDPAFIAYTVQLHPRPSSTAYPEVRIFRNDPRIRFTGRIHENIKPGLDHYQSQLGGQIGKCDLTIDHKGFEVDQLHKHHRNLPLLRIALREQPDRIFCWCHLATIYFELGKERNAKKAWNRALDIARKSKQLKVDACLPFLSLIQWKLKAGQNPQPLLKEALSRFPTNLQLHWLSGQALMAGNQIEEAIAVFEHIITCGKTGHYDHTLAYDQRLLGELPLSQIATCYFQLKDYATSGHYFELAANSAPDNLEYRVKRELCSKLGRTSSSTMQASASQPNPG